MSKLRSTKTTATKRGGWNTQREAAAGGESKSSSNVALDEAVDNHAGAIATIREDIQQSVKQRIHEVKHFLCAQLLRQHLGQVVHHREQRLRLVALRALLQLSNGLCSDTATKIPNKNKQGNSEVSLVSIQQVVQAPFLNHTAKTRQIRQTDRQTGGQMDTHTHTHARVRLTLMTGSSALMSPWSTRRMCSSVCVHGGMGGRGEMGKVQKVAV